jgi:Zn-dependent metalloprotease
MFPSGPPCRCCFIVPPGVLKALSRRQRVAVRRPEIFMASYHESERLREVRETQRTAAIAAAPAFLIEPPPRQPRQLLFDCANHTTLPGAPVVAPGAPGSGFQTVSETTASLIAFYKAVLGRNSIDNRGADLGSNLNYGIDYQNAFWDGKEMVYGNGDQQVFVDFWRSPDVIGHELTHGMTQHESGLALRGESGALNESLSDCFGAVFHQWLNKTPAIHDEGWLIGAGIMGPEAVSKGYTCLRDMANPGGAHCLSPQPDRYDHFDSAADIHENSGIPSKAFVLFARAMGGAAYEAPIRLWYAACTGGRLKPDSGFADFARQTLLVADGWNGPEKPLLATALRQAWDVVKIPIPSV